MDAIKSITINSAELLGCDDRIVSLKDGYDADMVVLNGEPLDVVKTKVIMTIINGEIVYRRKEKK